MGLLNVNYYATTTPTRLVDPANNTRRPIAPIDYVLALNEPSPVLSDRSLRYVQTGMLFTRRGTDLQDSDEITIPEGTFAIVGGPQFDMNHPMTGSDFGWVKYSVRRGG